MSSRENKKKKRNTGSYHYRGEISLLFNRIESKGQRKADICIALVLRAYIHTYIQLIPTKLLTELSWKEFFLPPTVICKCCSDFLQSCILILM